MFSKKSSPVQLDAPNTIIGKGILLEAARMTGQESVRIDGEYRGDIDIDGNLVLGDTSLVTGSIHAKYIVAAGQVNGNIRCETVLHFAATARILGDVHTQFLIVDEGSQLSGQYQVGELQPDMMPIDRPSARRPLPQLDDKLYTDMPYLEKSLNLNDTEKK